MPRRINIAKEMRKAKIPEDEKSIIVHNTQKMVGIIVHNLDKMPKDERGIIVHNTSELVSIIVHNLDKMPAGEHGIIIHNLTELVGIIIHNLPKDGFLESFKANPVEALKNANL